MAEQSTAGRIEVGAGHTDAEQVVRDFLDALQRMDVDAALALLDEEVTYQNVPFPPARGKAAVAKQLEALNRYFRGFEVVYDNVATNGPVVLTERTDILTVGPVPAAFWVCGTFEVHDGRITLWRDRFDFVDFALAFVRGSAKVVMDRLSSRPPS